MAKKRILEKSCFLKKHFVTLHLDKKSNMTTVAIDYKNCKMLIQKALESILSLRFFKVQRIEKSRGSDLIRKKGNEFVYSPSKQTLTKDWLNKNENEAWKNL